MGGTIHRMRRYLSMFLLRRHKIIPGILFGLFVYVGISVHVIYFLTSSPQTWILLSKMEAQEILTEIREKDIVLTKEDQDNPHSVMNIAKQELESTKWDEYLYNIEQSSVSRCHGNLTQYYNETFLLRNALVDKNRAISLLEERVKNDPLRNGQLKYVTVICETPEDLESDDAPFAKKYFEICLPKVMDFYEMGSTVIDKFTIAIKRYESFRPEEIANVLLQALCITRYLSEDPSQSYVLFLDNLSVDQVQKHWGMFGYYNDISSLPDLTVFRKLLLIIS